MNARVCFKHGWIFLFGAVAASAQSSGGLTARELYFREDAAAAKPAVKAASKAAAGATSAATPKAAPKASETAAVQPKSSGPRTPSGVPVVHAAMHLGVRYNVLRVTDRAAKKRVPVDADTAFHSGDCVAIQVEPNRSGYLYVFNLGSSGSWQPLLPSPQMPEENNRVASGKPLLVPRDHCFEFDGTAGKERLLLVVTEREEDMRRLGETMRRSMGDPKPAPAGSDKGQIMMAGGRMPSELAFLQQAQMIGRDIKIAKIGTAQSEGEEANAVYAVKTSTSASDRLVVEVVLRHE